MTRSVRSAVLLHAILLAYCVALGVWAGAWFGLTAALSLVVLKPVAIRRFGRWGIIGAWVCTAGFTLGIWGTRNGTLEVDQYCAAFAWLMAMILLVPRGRKTVLPSGGWKVLAFVWAFYGASLWLTGSYERDDVEMFHFGLLATLVLLALCRGLFRMGSLGVQVVNTLILLVIAVPTADYFLRSSESNGPLRPDGRYYAYEEARKNPAAFARWCRFCDAESDRLTRRFFMPDPAGVLSYRLRPGAEGPYLYTRIAINHLGFRGPEISLDKGRAYRIVALGESTTFGVAMRPNEKPWPELLERMIVERLKPTRPVQVINAGIPGYTIEDNLHRFMTDILPLKPDLILSYHGFNGFKLVNRAIPPVVVKAPPPYKARPLMLLGNCEYRLKLYLFERRELVRLPVHPPPFGEPMQTEYAADYRRLIELTRTNGIRLTLATYSMAVNRQSDLDVIEFYRQRVRTTYWAINANEVHSALVRGLTQEFPEVALVDTRPQLDGKHECFIDLMHLTEEGRRRVAEAMFAGIEPILKEDLASSVADGSRTNR